VETWTLKQVQGDDGGVVTGRERQPFVYILASRPRGTLYIGVSSDLLGRIWKHRNGTTGGFVSKYCVHRLVHLEPFGDMEAAIGREKQLKRWHRQWKINLIEAQNPHWSDLAVGLGFEPLPEEAPRKQPDRGVGGGLDPEKSSG
jgi:putative endonuclease